MIPQIPNLSLSLDVVGGADIRDTIKDALDIANILKIFVIIEPNGVNIWIKPGDTISEPIEDYNSK